jgi:hypothetical protein
VAQRRRLRDAFTITAPCEESPSIFRMANGGKFWSARGLMHLTIGLNVARYFLGNKSFDNVYSVSRNNTIGAMLVSMFTHLNAEHLL